MNPWDDPQAAIEEFRRQGLSAEVVAAFEGTFCVDIAGPEDEAAVGEDDEAQEIEPEPAAPGETAHAIDPVLQRILQRCEERRAETAAKRRANPSMDHRATASQMRF